MKKLQSKSLYDKSKLDDDEYKKYKDRQIVIHDKKMHYKRSAKEYEICASNMIDSIKVGGKMLCLGTRNEYEKESFKQLLSSKNIQVFSQDIATLANADYTCDFNELSKHVPADWDIIFSNCLDHAIDAGTTVNEWLKVLNTGGIMILGFCFQSTGDVCEFTQDSIETFISANASLEKINHYAIKRWNYWTLRKK